MKDLQIIISGLGGQGVLFITKLLAGAAMAENCRVMTSETHGMAQRGGNVISYLKIGEFSGPLIRPGKADALIALKEESFYHHNYFIGPEGFAVVNSPGAPDSSGMRTYWSDAENLALEAGSPRSANIVMLGFFTAVLGSDLITLESMAGVVQNKFKNKENISAGVLDLLDKGFGLYGKDRP